MKKKLVALLLATTMVLSLVACGGSNGNDNAPAGTEESEGSSESTESSDTSNASAEDTDNGDIYEVVMQYPTLGTTPADIQMVEDAINERTESEIGVHVTLYPGSAFDLNNTSNLMISSGEKLDLLMSMFEGGIASYVNKGQLIELDDLIAEYGQDIIAAEDIAMSGGYFGGKLYGVPTEEKMGRVRGFLCRKDLLDKHEIAYDENHIYTYDEISEIFATVKAGEGEGFYCIAGNSGDEPASYYFDQYDFLGSSLASGSLPNYGVGSTDIVNYYATDYYAKSCGYTRGWYEKGYYSPDCNTITDSTIAQMQSGNYFGWFANTEPDMIASANSGLSAYVDTEVVALYTSEPAALTQNYQITIWGIPITCDNPEKTMQWLNMMYADKDIINLLKWGIEGTHYEFEEGSDCVVRFPDGVDAATVGYTAMLNVWGDKSKDYVMAPLDETYYQQLKDFNDSVTADYTSAALGYCFNSDPVKTQFAAVSDVISQYQSILGMGVVDPEKTIPEFLSALEAAGINDVIEENQSQLDAWLEMQ